MHWNDIQHGCYKMVIPDGDDGEIRRKLSDFWKRFAGDVIPQIDAESWDYLMVNIRGADGGIGIYAQHAQKPPFRVPWAHLGIPCMGATFGKLDEGELGEEEAQKLNQSYASMLISAAQDADLARLCGRTDGLPIRFFDYGGVEEPPIMERVVHSAGA